MPIIYNVMGRVYININAWEDNRPGCTSWNMHEKIFDRQKCSAQSTCVWQGVSKRSICGQEFNKGGDLNINIWGVCLALGDRLRLRDFN